MHLEEPGARCLALDDDPFGQLRKPLDDGALPVSRPARNRVQHRDHRDRELGDEIEHLGAILPAEDPELVLDDDDVDPREGGGGGLPGSAGPTDELGRHFLQLRGGAGPVDAPDHDRAVAGAGRGDRLRKGGGERRDAALGGRVRAHKPDGAILDQRPTPVRGKNRFGCAVPATQAEHHSAPVVRTLAEFSRRR